jgi:hypothetical protein
MARAWRWLASAAIAGALVLLLVNDWVLKPAQSFWVGKLSDLAGLFLIPVPLVGLHQAIAPRLAQARARWLLHPLTSCAAVAVIFAGAKTSHWAAARLACWWPWPAAWGEARIVADPTDLLALAVLPVGYAIARRFWGPGRPRPG